MLSSDNISINPASHLSQQREPPIGILEKKRFKNSRSEGSRKPLETPWINFSEEKDSAIKESGKFHSVPKNLIKELGPEASAVLYGFGLILKTYKRNLRDGYCWYYETLDQLILKRWPYLKRSTLFTIVHTLRDKGYLLISGENRKPYDRTMQYSMSKSRIERVLDDQQFWFDVDIAKKTGVLAALLFHNIQYRIFDDSQNRAQDQETMEHRPKIEKLSRIFHVSESTVKRQLKILVNHGLLAKSKKKGSYAFPFKNRESKNGADLDENRSNLDMDSQKWPGLKQESNGSNLDDNRSNLDEIGSNLDENRSNLDNNTIYETNRNHIGIQMRIAPRAFLKKEEIEESDVLSVHSGFKNPVEQRISYEQDNLKALSFNNVIEHSFSSNPKPSTIGSETALAAHESAGQIDHSESAQEQQESAVLIEQTGQIARSLPEADLDGSARSRIFHEQSASGSEEIRNNSAFCIEKTSRKNRALNSMVSFGRKIETSQGSDPKFYKLTLKNQKIENILVDQTPEKRLFVQDTFLRLAVRFAESLSGEKRIILLKESTPDRVLDLIFEEAYSFIESRSEEFMIDGEPILSSERTFPLFPFLEILVRSILLFKNSDPKSFLSDKFSLYSIFESLSSGFLDRPDMSAETKALFFNFMTLRARSTRIDNKLSNGKSLNLCKYNESRFIDFYEYSSETEFASLVEFFEQKGSICSEEVFFKFSKCIEWKVLVGKSESEYDQRWHCVNFRDISQFLKFYPKISDAIEASFPDFERAWKCSSEEEDNIYDLPALESRFTDLAENQRDVEEPERLDRLKEYFKKVKQETLGENLYIPTPLQELDFKEALSLCKKYDLAPEDIVDLAVELLGKADVQLSTIHLRGALVKKALVSEIVNDPKHARLVTSENLAISDVWQQQIYLLKTYTRNNESPEDVLLDASLKFYSWFRILVPETPIAALINKYRDIARRELDYKIKRYVRRIGLDLCRICE